MRSDKQRVKRLFYGVNFFAAADAHYDSLDKHTVDIKR